MNIPDKHKIAIISKSQETSYYIKASLDALNKSGELLNISEYLKDIFKLIKGQILDSEFTKNSVNIFFIQKNIKRII